MDSVKPVAKHRGALLLALTLAACGDDSGPAVASTEHQLAPSRTYQAVGRSIDWKASPAERHGISAKDFAGATAPAPTGGASATSGLPADDAGGAAAEQPLHWTTPPGWTEKPPAPFRDVNFAVAGDARAECYLTTLAGEAGGLDANINRWRTQLSLPPLGPDEIAALPRQSWFGAPAVAVDFSGRWAGMSGDQAAPAEEDWRLIGLLQVTPEQSRFLKLVGPAAVIDTQIPAFHALAESFHVDGSEHGAALHAAERQSTSQSSSPSATESAANSTAQSTPPRTAAPADSQRSASLAWRAPPGWTRGAEKPMRELTYFAGEGQQVECAVTLLTGEAGGLLANLNRWCGQMGAPPMTEADVARLEHITLAGSDAVLVRLERGPDATAPENHELLLGAIGRLGESALFVKMLGPHDAVESQGAALVAFCNSLRAAP